MSLPVNSVKEYVELARTKPGMQYGDGGSGSTQTMATEILRAVAGIKIEPVQYKGAPPVIPDLINGLVTRPIIPSSVAIPPVKGGKLRALANTSDRRSPMLPDVPTIAEAGYPEATVLSWYGFHAPAGTPREVIQRISDATRAATATPEVRERAADAERWERALRLIKH
jgi:tripartite-type tricarboxylate transporter receptor subunit TctC